MKLILLGGAVVLFILAIFAYNGLVTLRSRVTQAFADVDVQLKQRHDLIPNLIATVKGYAAHERGTFESVIESRNKALAAKGTADQAAAENMLSGAVGRLLALGEAYPDLKSSTNFQQLQSDLADIEEKLAAARRFFNNAVAEYNAAIQHFPALVFADSMGFKPQASFDLGEVERKNLDEPPKVAF